MRLSTPSGKARQTIETGAKRGKGIKKREKGEFGKKRIVRWPQVRCQGREEGNSDGDCEEKKGCYQDGKKKRVRGKKARKK